MKYEKYPTYLGNRQSKSEAEDRYGRINYEGRSWPKMRGAAWPIVNVLQKLQQYSTDLAFLPEVDYC
jgi:hypothetical protein